MGWNGMGLDHWQVHRGRNGTLQMCMQEHQSLPGQGGMGGGAAGGRGASPLMLSSSVDSMVPLMSRMQLAIGATLGTEAG